MSERPTTTTCDARERAPSGVGLRGLAAALERRLGDTTIVMMEVPKIVTPSIAYAALQEAVEELISHTEVCEDATHVDMVHSHLNTLNDLKVAFAKETAIE